MNNGKLQLSRLGDLTTLISSGSTPRGGEAVYLKDGPVMLVRSQNVRMNSLDLSDVAYISDEINSEMKRSVICQDDVLLNITGASIGRVARFSLSKPHRANVNQHVCIIRTVPLKLDSRFLTYYLSSPQVQHDINNRHQHGGTRQALTFSQIADFMIPVPPLPEQRRIADILDKADAIRRKRQEANQLASSIAASLCDDRFGDPVSNRKGWDVVAMEFLYAIAPNYGTMIVPSESRKGWLDLRVANIQNGVLDLSDKKFVDLPEDAIYRHEVRRGDLLLARAIGSIDHLGKCFIADPGEDRWAFDSHLMRVRFDTTKVEPRYVHAFLSSPGGRHEFLRNSRRSAVQFNINTKEMARIQIPLPPLDVQREFIRDLDRLSAIARRQMESDAEISNLFSSLVQRAFRGEL